MNRFASTTAFPPALLTVSLPIGLLLSLTLAGCSDSSDSTAQPIELPPPASSLTVRSQAVPEGAAGTMGSIKLPVFMDRPQPEDVTVRYRTTDGDATAESDYLATTGEVIVFAGSLAADITLEILGDAEPEPAERFELQLEVEGNVQLTSNTAVVTLSNDDNACDSPYTKEPNPWLVNGADPLNFAHRGGVIDFPENTLYAYYEAAKAGADVLEMDVYQTADNELVIIHDLGVDRTTNGSGNIVDLTLAELRALDAAYWFVPGQGTPQDAAEADYAFRGIATGELPPPAGYRAEDFRIPTLEEALQSFPHELLNLELKPDLDDNGDYEQQMATLLRRYGRSADVIAVSFVDEAALAFKTAAPCVHSSVPLDQGTVLVLGSQGDAPLPEVPEHVAFQVPPDTSQISQIPDDFFLRVVTPDFIADSHNSNLAVHVWTVNSCEEMLEMIELGVDGIMTDRPLLLEDLLNTPASERACD